MAGKDAEGAYFFDRNAEVFEVLLNWYRTTKLIIPRTMPKEMVQMELNFFNIEVEEEDIII